MSTKIRIGWSQQDITPRVPVALWGQFNLRLATRVQDPLTLTALAVDNGDDHAVIVSMDICAVRPEVLSAARATLAERLPDFDPARLIVSATHTHTAPCVSGSGWHTDAEYLAPRARSTPTSCPSPSTQNCSRGRW